jgi:hypothetical protein
MKIWVKVPPSQDPALLGKERRRKPGGGPARFFTGKAEEVEEGPAITRLILTGDLIKADGPEEN